MTAPETAFCPTCRTMREVMDTYATDDGDRYGDRPADRHDRIARPLSCGHDATDGGDTPPPSRFTPDPGLPARVTALQAGAQ